MQQIIRAELNPVKQGTPEFRGFTKVTDLRAAADNPLSIFVHPIRGAFLQAAQL